LIGALYNAAEPIALEGALKIKEMCYLHAEGFSGGALKHGPFALIEGTCSDALVLVYNVRV
jgi:glucosamine 6-phosphate synthetase-like amidotransferase/phosphosugar isomerase protein